ncbi:Histidine kinase [Gammaproteobacteria bacterium]
MIQSFRLRLALLSAVLAGITLAIFGFSALWLILDVKVEHIDRALRAHAERETGRPPWNFDWARVERDIAASLSLREARDLLLLIQDSRGETVYRSWHWPDNLDVAGLPWPRLALPSDRYQRQRPITAITEEHLDRQIWRLGLATSGHVQIAVAVNLRTLADEMRGIRMAFLIATPVALFLISLGAWFFSKRALRPIEKLTAATQRVTASGLDQRIAITGNDREFAELITVFNGMLERLERSFQQSRRFSADAAHELKTPLAILQGQLERAIHYADEGSATQAELTSILDEVRRLSMISRKLLLLSQADAGQLQLQREFFSLSEALDNLVEDTRMLAPHLQVSAEIQPNITIIADRPLLHQILHNLISNAIKYNIDNGSIHFLVRTFSGQVEIGVINSSLGIPLDERDRIFDRFYRATQADGRKIDGVGLGLALSREIARAHGGDLSFKVDEAGNVSFSCILPVVNSGTT